MRMISADNLLYRVANIHKGKLDVPTKKKPFESIMQLGRLRLTSGTPRFS